MFAGGVMVLWSSDKIDPKFLSFTSGDDLSIDAQLVPYVKKSLSLHARNLFLNGHLTKGELNNSLRLIESAELELTVQNEDCHTALYEALKKQDKALANKLRAFKSRNEEVAVTESFFFLDKLVALQKAINRLIHVICSKARELRGAKWIGFTHTRMATVGTAEHWLLAYSEQLKFLKARLPALRKYVSVVSLGSGPGFGSELKIIETGGLKNCRNPQLMQHLRVFKHLLISHFCLELSTLFSRFSSDVIFYGSDNNAYVLLSPKIAQGSSAMPHKLNPDLFEIIRANHSRFQAWVQICSSHGHLISGYHRDYQLSKEASVRAITLLLQEADILAASIKYISLDEKKIARDIKENDNLLSFSKLSEDSLAGKDITNLYNKMRDHSKGQKNKI